jgi:hypothetical protein
VASGAWAASGAEVVVKQSRASLALRAWPAGRALADSQVSQAWQAERASASGLLRGHFRTGRTESQALAHGGEIGQAVVHR